jgi:hypothetical protein
MNQLEWMFRTFNGGLASLRTTDAYLAANVVKVLGSAGPDVFELNEHGADLMLQSLYGRAFLKVLWEPKNIVDELARKVSGCPGVLKNGWWQRTLGQIVGLTFHHTLSDSPHATAKHYIKKGGGRPSIPYTIWITQTGEVLLCNPLEDGCWHDHTGHKNVNLSVGLAGRLHKYRPSQVQLEAAAQVVKWAIEHPEMNITMNKVLGHMDVGTYKGRTECPGWDSAASDFWKDDFYKLLV